MRTLFAAAMAVVVSCLPLGTSAADNGAVAPSSEIQHALDLYAAGFPDVGVVAAVVANGTPTIYTAGSLGSGVPALSDRTVFEIGSVTKTFTATLLAQMVGAGQVALNDPIAKYLPKGVTAPSYGGQQITLANLAEQNSGLPRLPTNFKTASASDPYATYTSAMLYEYLSHATIDRAPGAQYDYSNLGVGLLGDLLALRAGTTYPHLVQERVLTPLGLHDTSAAPSAALLAKLAPGHDADGDRQGRWTFGELGAAGAMVSDGHDMLAFLQANMAAPSGALGAAMALAQQPRADIELGDRPMKIGLVWTVNPQSGIVFHNGQTGGYHSFIAFDRANRNGVVLIANVTDDNLDTLAMHILEPDTVSAPPPYPAVVQVPPATLDTYAGVYQLAPKVTITISHDGQRAYAQVTGQGRYRIFPSSPTEFYFKIADAQVTFELDATGHVQRLVLHQNGADAPAPKVK
jgi:CubicO group peptidase (beta-lactamase class C family)